MISGKVSKLPRFQKVLLVNPAKTDQAGYTSSPLGLLYLASYLRLKERSIPIAIIDGAIEDEPIVGEKIKKFKPDLVGITVMTPGRHQALKVARFVKKTLRGCKVILGGIHPTLMWEQMMQNYPEVDYIVRGEGEITLFELVTGKKLEEIDSLVWRSTERQIINNKDRSLIQNLDDLPFPAWDLIDPLKYPARGEGKIKGIDLEKEVRVPIIFSRGCMGSCTYCSSWRVWRGYRCRSGKNVADEVEFLVKRYNIKHFCFNDDSLGGVKEAIIDFCKEIIRRKINIVIVGCTRVDLVDREILDWMRRAGFYSMAYGVESGSSESLKRINKKIDIEAVKKAFSLTKKFSMKTVALMMYGLPEETSKDRKLTEKLLAEIKPDGIGTLGEVWIFPGTVLHEQAKKAKLLDDRFWLGKRPHYIYRGGIGSDPINWRAVFWDTMRYYFADTFFNRTRIRLLLAKEWLTGKIVAILRKLYHKIFLRVNFDLAMRYMPVVEFIRKHYNLEKVSILEIGSSSEGLAAFLPVKVTGADIRFSGKVRSNLTPVTIKGSELPFKNNSFDCVVCVDTLEHIPMRGRQNMIKEMIRVGRKNVVIVVPLGEKAATQDKKLHNLFFETWGRQFEFLVEHLKFGLPTRSEIIKQIEVSLKNCQKTANIKYQPICNLYIHGLFMKAMIEAKDKLTEFRALTFNLLVPLRKLLNFGSYYRGFFIIELH